jgi:hypothetical protein
MLDPLPKAPASMPVTMQTKPIVTAKPLDSLIHFANKEYEIIQNMNNGRAGVRGGGIDRLFQMHRVFNSYSLKLNLAAKIVECLTTSVRKFNQQ